MMIHTTYRLLETAGAEYNCGGYRPLADAIGVPSKYGFGRPIAIETILDVCGIADALWALRAVMPEQEVAAERIARSIAIEAFAAASGRFRKDDKFLCRSIAVARAYLEGDEDRNALAATRRNVWYRSDMVSMPFRLVYYSAWLALAAQPHHIANQAYRNLRDCFPSEMSQRQQRELPAATKEALTLPLRNLLTPARECTGFGPGDSEPEPDAKVTCVILGGRKYLAATH